VQLLHYVISSSLSCLIAGLFNAVRLMPYWNQQTTSATIRLQEELLVPVWHQPNSVELASDQTR